MTKNLTILLLIGLLTATLAGAALAQPGHGGHGAGPGAAYKALTPEQAALAAKIHREKGEAVWNLRHQLAGKRHELNYQLTGEKPDEKRVAELTKEIGGLEAKLAEAQAALALELKKNGLPYGGPGGCPKMGGMGGHGSHGKMMGGPGGMMMGDCLRMGGQAAGQADPAAPAQPM